MAEMKNKLMERVLEKSEAKTWDEAVLEWEIWDYKEDDEAVNECACGQEGLKCLFTIKNTKNGNILFPIGSTCIKKFGRKELDRDILFKQKLFKLLKAIKEGEEIEISSKYFSRRMLEYFFKSGVFPPNDYNGHNGYYDYRFLLNIFNGKSVTANQEKKVRALIYYNIKPFLEEEFRGKAVD